MGLALPALCLLAREHKKRPLKGPVLTIGRQCVYATVEDITTMLREENLTVHPLPSTQSTATNIPAWKNTPNEQYTSDQVFFQLLTGLPVAALDVSAYEGAEYVWDLNNPVPDDWTHKFGTVIDSGSLEHVFNIKQALINMNRLTAPHGKIIHITPANNYLEHGFFQFSPTLFIDYYSVNNFEKLSCILIEQSTWDGNTSWYGWEWGIQRPYTPVMNAKTTALFVSAEKGANSTEHITPQQGQGANHGEGGRTGEFTATDSQKKIIEQLPLWLITIVKRLLGKDLRKKPWGLKYLGKI
ncbi:MAG TPA: hypothetical protein VJI96_02920 [Candidatus Andersenbacteria bacterium]|nr:hypothetical protein [Candidatus Andersenbacteria bacterium]